ncbi:nitroreductase family protein [Actinokineospora sp. UTMC 2448]|uniref:nitroreductase family protein n=1 Tax=Actinokineospora sp. UTMC 2448 TaxID=2268449 RepID=UPI002164BCC1|nr:nitroreductase family protein [Actinokineospora sp. UTMC 2448]UVS78671.1 Dehydrogenase PerF [Actinokineospora sp. UTMC 2448]
MRSPSVPVIDGFTAALRETPKDVNPADWRVDWDRAPWPVKVYADADRVPLGTADPLGRLLWLGFGVTRVRFDPAGGRPPTPRDPAPAAPRYLTRRPIPSGGGMYPTEVYVLRDQRAYHYDPYRHDLVDLHRPVPAGTASVALVLANRPGKNYFKYGDFAARLGAVDAGVAVGRAVRLGQAAFGHTELCLDFADERLNALLGLDGAEETALAVLGLGRATCAEPVPRPACDPPTTVDRRLPVPVSDRFDALRRAAYQHTPPLPVPDRRGPAPAVPPVDAAALLRRTSNGRLFTGRAVARAALTRVLDEATAALDLLRWSGHGLLGQDVDVRCAVHNVDGVEPGWYGRDLVGVPGDTGRVLQAALFAETYNVDLAAFTVHVVAATDHRAAGRGERGYREQQLAVGAAVDAVVSAAAALGLGSHPVLGFDTPAVDRAYGLTGTGRGAHAQISVGAVRPAPYVEVTVMPR